MASEAEQEIRNATIREIRNLLPDARIMHELPAGQCRADLAAITPNRVILFELKSEKDKLDRLEDQMRTFSAYGHLAIAVLHDKFFDRTPYDNGAARYVAPEEACVGHPNRVWAYPTPPNGTPQDEWYTWEIPDTGIRQPAARTLLYLLHSDEQRAVLGRYGLKKNGDQCARVDRIAYHLTGQQIATEVCRELRARPVLYGDEPIFETSVKREGKDDG